MSDYEYKVVPAPSKGRKAKGRTSNADRFAVSIEDTLNEIAAEGWEYLRSELLPSDERSGLTGSTREWRNVLIFRRLLPGRAVAPLPDTTRVPQAQPMRRPEPQVKTPPVATRRPPRTVDEIGPVPQFDDGYDDLSEPQAIHDAHVTKLAEARRARHEDPAPEAGPGNGAQEKAEPLNPLARAVRLSKGDE